MIIIKRLISQLTFILGIVALVLGIAIAIINSNFINPSVGAIETMESALNSGKLKKLKKVFSKEELEESGIDNIDEYLDMAISGLDMVYDGKDITFLQGHITEVDADNYCNMDVTLVVKDGHDYSVKTETIKLYKSKGKLYLSMNN